MELPVLSSAPTTKFSVAEVRVGSDVLYLDGNQKITWDNGTFDDPRPNALSILQVDDCPHATPSCSSACYVHSLEKYQPEVHALYRHNSQVLHRLVDGGAWELAAIDLAHHISLECRGGFRWHVSGDVFSLEHGRFIAAVCEMSKAIRHWIYTRSFPLVGTELLKVSTAFDGNLVLNLSCDRDNYSQAALLAISARLRLCYFTSDGEVPRDLPAGSVIFPDYHLRQKTEEGRAWFKNLPPHQKAMACPVDRLGKSEKVRCGPCKRCLK